MIDLNEKMIFLSRFYPLKIIEVDNCDVFLSSFSFNFLIIVFILIVCDFDNFKLCSYMTSMEFHREEWLKCY